MSEFYQINLKDIIEELGEDRTKSILSDFSCPKNKDVEIFLREKSIEFAKRGLGITHLIYWKEGNEKELIGYYTLAQKHFEVKKNVVSKNTARRLNAHGEFDSDTRKYIIPAPLIGQLGKNFNRGNDTLICGDELLKMALNKVKDIQYEFGGRYTYLECEDKPKLISFYEKNGFQEFGRRKLDKDEVNVHGKYVIQLMRYMN